MAYAFLYHGLLMIYYDTGCTEPEMLQTSAHILLMLIRLIDAARRANWVPASQRKFCLCSLSTSALSIESCRWFTWNTRGQREVGKGMLVSIKPLSRALGEHLTLLISVDEHSILPKDAGVGQEVVSEYDLADAVKEVKASCHRYRSNQDCLIIFLLRKSDRRSWAL
jgi:hypothetical protein